MSEKIFHRGGQDHCNRARQARGQREPLTRPTEQIIRDDRGAEIVVFKPKRQSIPTVASEVSVLRNGRNLVQIGRLALFGARKEIPLINQIFPRAIAAAGNK
jgi:hypothetical protein